MFTGSIVAIITPFTKDNKIDEQKLRELIEFQIENGTNGILPCGTTGESPTLSHDEHNKVIEVTIDAVKGRVPVIAGTGSNSTEEAIALTKHAKDVGADGALIVSPYYNKPTQEGLYQHFKAIADNVDIPIILYNIAGRTAVNIDPLTVARLAKDCKNIIGVKEASGSLNQAQETKQHCPTDFLILSGDDALTLPILSIGGHGVISVLANIVPQDIVGLIKLYQENKTAEALALNDRLFKLAQAMFVETNPIPVKKAAEIVGLCSGSVRLPLTEASLDTSVIVENSLKEYGVKHEVRN